MRWQREYYRIVKRFALFPINHYGEVRWLEWVYLDQEHVFAGLYTYWLTRGFSTKEEYEKYLRRKKNA